jgi:hypothetical protein
VFEEVQRTILPLKEGCSLIGCVLSHDGLLPFLKHASVSMTTNLLGSHVLYSLWAATHTWVQVRKQVAPLVAPSLLVVHMVN